MTVDFYRVGLKKVTLLLEVDPLKERPIVELTLDEEDRVESICEALAAFMEDHRLKTGRPGVFHLRYEVEEEGETYCFGTEVIDLERASVSEMWSFGAQKAAEGAAAGVHDVFDRLKRSPDGLPLVDENAPTGHLMRETIHVLRKQAVLVLTLRERAGGTLQEMKEVRRLFLRQLREIDCLSREMASLVGTG